MCLKSENFDAYRRGRRTKGIALVWSAIMLIVLILALGVVIDASRVHLTANQLQNAADAAALAGARMVRINQDYCRTQAQYIGGLNFALGASVLLDLNSGNDPNGDIVIGRFYGDTRTFIPTNSAGLPKPNAMKVTARRMQDEIHQPVPLMFGPIANFDNVDVARVAIAQAQGGLGAGLIVLSEDPTEAPSLSFNGNPFVNVIDGAIQVNMINPHPPVDLGGSQVTVIADEFNVVSKNDSTDGYVFDAATGLTVTTGQPKIPDPYRNVPPPAPNPATPINEDTIQITTGDTPPPFEPGYYPGGFNINGGTAVFKPGIYVLGGGKNGKEGLTITGGNVCALRVMFFIAESGNVKITGSKSGNITITEINNVNPGLDCSGNPVTYSQSDSYVAPYKGISIFQDRSNTNDATIGGGSGLNIEGTLYFPSNHLDLGGSSGSMGIEVVTDTLTIHGTGSGDKLNITYDGRNRTSANRAYLVE